MNKKMYASALVGERLPLYVVGAEYDDFYEGGFAIISICDNLETAKEMMEKAEQDFPPLKEKNCLTIRKIYPNKFYDNWI